MTSDDVPASVFHYTDMAGLLGIVSAGELRATESSGMNDPLEVGGGLARVRRWLEAHHGDPTAQTILDDVLPADAEDSHTLSFVLSASLDHDDATQWRLYGDGGDGCCIELDTSRRLTVRTAFALPHERGLDKQTGQLKPNRHPQSRFVRGWDNVASVTPWTIATYSDGDVDTKLEALLLEAAIEFKDAESTAQDNDDAWIDAKQRILDRIAELAGTLKSATWQHEREARVVATLTAHNPHSQFRASRYGLVQYVRLAEHTAGTRLPIARKGTWRVPLKSVTLGPRQDFQLALPSVQGLLHRHGYRTAVSGVVYDDIAERVIVRESNAALR